MKREHILCALLFVASFCGCSYNELPEELGKTLPIEDKISLNVETRAEVYNGVELDQTYFVTATDLENFVKFRKSESGRENLSVKEVKSYGFDSTQTLFYILNYNEGWEVVAADKRVQPTLAHGDNGEFTMDCDNEPMKFWMNMIAEGVLQKRLAKTEVQTTTTTAAASNTNTTDATTSSDSQYVDFWNRISPTDDVTKVEVISPIIGPRPPIDGIEYTYLVDEECEHKYIEYSPFTITSWNQSAPWNAYCPLKTDGSGDRAPAGCVAISAAQVLYYLHDYFNAMWLAPVHCFYNGDVKDPYIYFDAFHSNVWYYMATSDSDTTNDTYTEYSALLIAYVGQLIGMKYGNTGSSASTMNLKEKVFSEFDISCSESNSYNLTKVINEITKQLPVILRGEDSSGAGHSWFTNGYKKEYDLVTSYYVRYSTEQSPVYIATLDKDDAHYSSTSETIVNQELWMDWGWNDTFDGWYSAYPDASWGYSESVKMVYNFQTKN